MGDSMEPIVLLVDDIMFATRLENLVRQAGFKPIFAENEAALTRAMTTAPVLAMVDIFSAGMNWEPLVRQIKGPGKKSDHVPVLGFGPHTDMTLRRRALDAGCAAVVARSAIVTQLPALVEKHRWRVEHPCCGGSLPPLVERGLQEFNRGQYYRCHETLEDAWNAEARSVRLLYQGILQIGVGFFHITKGNWRGAAKVLERGIPKLARFAPACQGVDVAALLADAQTVHTEILRLGADGLARFDTHRLPKIVWEG